MPDFKKQASAPCRTYIILSVLIIPFPHTFFSSRTEDLPPCTAFWGSRLSSLCLPSSKDLEEAEKAG